MQNPDIFVAIVAVSAFALGIYLFLNFRSLNRLRTVFFAGRSGADLEAVLHSLTNELGNLKSEHLVLQHTLAKLVEEGKFSIQKIGVVKFNPFADAGGNLSFTLALLDAYDNGVVLTSMHGRLQDRIYTKRILSGKGETGLTEEEQQAISTANQKSIAFQEH